MIELFLIKIRKDILEFSITKNSTRGTVEKKSN